ncbi:MAG: C2H2-type zinc finger protein [Nitrososphaera sp.]|nr:C2H2-type zinc finger protein [uncultured Nitrososphaera sp.]
MSTASSSAKKAENRCNLCGKVFTTPELLESHKKMEHSKQGHPPAGVS